eukprot:TRINITY_DN8074_c0_g1_i3.p1 TRINITY_DN8074_c0_g1~~TRINITY_DN8074_c0_g1_i3.p1  ORF type:complete len:833 (+),score=156.41 TRINITY_DN8074_c0_g1_i3:228-2501(+)
MPSPGLSKQPSSWTIIEPRHPFDDNLKILVCTWNSKIIQISARRVTSTDAKSGPYTRISVSPNGNFLAFFGDKKSKIRIVTADFSTELTRISTCAPKSPEQLVWCGCDGVVGSWRVNQGGFVVMVVGPTGAFAHFECDGEVRVNSEVDGVRILDSNGYHFITRASRSQNFLFVPKLEEKGKEEMPPSTPSTHSTTSPSSSYATLSIATTNSASLLLFSHKQFLKRNSRSSEIIIRSIEPELEQAIMVLLDAACYEFSHHLQKELIEAARFGMSFLPGISQNSIDSDLPSTFILSVKLIRTMNMLRRERISQPLSIGEFQLLGHEKFVDLLVSRNLHFLAFQLCSFLGIHPVKIVVHWATNLIAGSTSTEDQLMDVILKKMSKVPGVSYSRVAYTAYLYKKPNLATKLLEFEPKPQDQVPLLLKMQKYDTALKVACASGDGDLVQMVLIVYKKFSTVKQFLSLLRSNSEANALWSTWCLHTDMQLLLDTYRALGRYSLINLAKQETKIALGIKETNERKERLIRVRKILKQAEKEISLQPPPTEKTTITSEVGAFFSPTTRGEEDGKILDINFFSKSLREEIDLLNYQQRLGNPTEQFIDSSITTTLFKLVLQGEEQKAKEMKQEFDIPSKRWWWTKIRALVSVGRWEGLSSFARSEKPPFGYGPFAEACLEANNFVEAYNYIKMMPDTCQKIKYLVQIDKWPEAILTVENMRKVSEIEKCIKFMMTTKNSSCENQIEILQQKFKAGQLGSFLGVLDF